MASRIDKPRQQECQRWAQIRTRENTNRCKQKGAKGKVANSDDSTARVRVSLVHSYGSIRSGAGMRTSSDGVEELNDDKEANVFGRT